MRGVKNKTKLPDVGMLPSCRICGEPGSGFHYGVTTCGACKGFFRRSLLCREPYECIKKPSCHIGPGTSRRESCPKCRYDRCLALGMSKDATKIGRYSLVKRNDNIKQAKKESSFLPTPSPFLTNSHTTSTYQQYKTEEETEISSTSGMLWRNKPSVDHLDTSIAKRDEDTSPSDYDSKYSVLAFEGDKELTPKQTGLLGTLNSRVPEIPSTYIPVCSSDVSSSSHQDLSLHLFSSLNVNENTGLPQNRQPTPLTPNKLLSSSSLSILHQSAEKRCKPSHTMVSYKTTISQKAATFVQPHNLNHTIHCSFINKNITPNYFPKSDSFISVMSPEDEYEEIHENEPSLKKPRISEKVESNSSEKNGSLIPVSNTNSKQIKRVALHFVVPSTLKYVLSVFEEFPFRSFEKRSLGPILKMCYEYDNMTAYKCNDFYQSLSKKKQIQRIRVHSPKPSAVPPFSPKQFPLSTSSLDQPMGALYATYDTAEMDRLFDYLRAIHCRNYGPKTAYMSDREKELAIEMYSKMCLLHDSLERANWIDDDKYYTILETTGIDVDKRKEWYSCFLEDFDTYFTKDIKFFRSLFKFKNLSLNDRLALTKSAFAIAMKLRQSPTTDHDRDVCIDEMSGFANRPSTMQRIIPPLIPVLDRWTVTLRTMKKLDISFDELIIIRVLIVVCPGLCELEDSELVSSWHNTYLQCLLHLIRKTHGPNAEDRFKQMFELIQDLKALVKLTESTRVLWQGIAMRLSNGKVPQLFREIFLQ